MRQFRIAPLAVVAVILAGTLLLAGAAEAQVKRHQATGTIATSGATQLVLLKTFGRNQARWNFVLNPKTKMDGKPVKGARVRIYYYNDAKGERVAEQIKLLEAASLPASKGVPASSASVPAPATH